jgi:hypothetical protein
MEAHADFIMAAVAEKSDITLEELRDCLAGKGVGVAVSTRGGFSPVEDTELVPVV